MRAGVITFPGSNCDRDLIVAFERLTGRACARLWHQDSDLPDLDVIGVPGGFSYGDYLRCGAISARAPIMAAVARAAERGVRVLGICNGFQILTECGLLPGALIRNASLQFVCKDVELVVETTACAFTQGYGKGQRIRVPVAHHDGNYVCDPATLAELKDQDRIAFRYVDNPNGSVDDIAGILNARRNVLGMMPHPERLADPALGGHDGATMFQMLEAVAA
ncbi:MAG: phosphoribosylformylglycinamidine synthase subunit PurQ [Geminicoccaceae bacterium]